MSGVHVLPLPGIYSPDPQKASTTRGLADVVTLQRHRQERFPAEDEDEERFFVDTLSAYQWAKDAAGLDSDPGPLLDEARESADPLRLMRLFGITDGTAMRYVSAAHPERTPNLPR